MRQLPILRSPPNDVGESRISEVRALLQATPKQKLSLSALAFDESISRLQSHYPGPRLLIGNRPEVTEKQLA